MTDTKKTLLLITEYLSGDNMFDYLQEDHGRMKENEANVFSGS